MCESICLLLVGLLLPGLVFFCLVLLYNLLVRSNSVKRVCQSEAPPRIKKEGRCTVSVHWGQQAACAHIHLCVASARCRSTTDTKQPTCHAHRWPPTLPVTMSDSEALLGTLHLSLRRRGHTQTCSWCVSASPVRVVPCTRKPTPM